MPTYNSNGLIGLPRLPGPVAELTGAKPPRYHTLYHKANAGEFPTVEVGGRLFVRTEDLPLVAAALGLSPSKVAA
jgi:hypothetical protein